MRDFDVIVIGGGGAGLAAAIEVHDAGGSCIVLEADVKVGGATALSGGVFYAANTSVQRDAGIADSADAMFEYLMTLNQWSVKPEIMRLIADRSGPTLEWLIGLGTIFPAQWLVCSGVESVPRGHSSQGAGTGIAETLINAAGAAGIEMAVDTRVERLLFENGRVNGIHACGMDLHAPAVIITTGGFGNNPQMVKRLFPSVWHEGWTWAVHERAPFIVGDGITMGETAGAAIVGYDTGTPLATPGFSRFVEAFLPPWIVMVNKEGRRFVSELSPYTVCGYLINEQTARVAYGIFDEPTLLAASEDTRYVDPYNSGIAFSSWEEASIRQHLANGRVKAAATIADLAAMCGIDVPALQTTLSRYNEDCAHGLDSAFFKPAPRRFPIVKPPFYAVEVRAAVIGNTGAGLDVDHECRVLDRHGRAISGLYAAGETTGVLCGKRYAGGGMMIGPAVTLGRVAGRTAATHALSIVD